ncbi:PTS sugar transporter subunit IIA [Anaerovirgula multivorans]|nr:PTS glucose transporter subunit IIA [Anaerovirgula multivorans]
MKRLKGILDIGEDEEIEIIDSREMIEDESNYSEILLSPMKGEVIPIEKIPHKVFNGKILGEGVAILPIDGWVLSPVEGRIIHIMDSKHAIGIKSINGADILIHVGIETEKLQGEGFQIFVQTGDDVKPGDKLIQFDLEYIKNKAKSPIMPMIISNSDVYQSVITIKSGQVDYREPLLELFELD